MSVREEIVERCRDRYRDVRLQGVREWKEETGGKAVGYMPIYVPRELIRAAGILPVGIMGGGDQVEIIRGDAFYQSYICHIPRSTLELGLSNWRGVLDGLICPSICDVIRNLSGIWKMTFPDVYVKYFDFPQDFDPVVGGEYFVKELRDLLDDLSRIGGKQVRDEEIHENIRLYNENRRLCFELYDRRADEPHKIPTGELYLIMRAGCTMDVEEHNVLVRDYIRAVSGEERKKEDNIRVVLIGSFCEQPPMGLIRTLERCGCYIVDDDLVLGSRWLTEEVSLDGDPVRAISDAFLQASTYSSTLYEGERTKGERLVETVRKRDADGVIFCCPSFCDPALLDQPLMQKKLDEAGIPYTSFQYAENTGQFQVIREQAGTFSDSIKLWSGV